MTDEKKDNKSVSVFSRSDISLETDPLEEIFALNLGDFVSEHLISDELVQKISRHSVDKSVSLKNQLKELKILKQLTILQRLYLIMFFLVLIYFP